MKKFAGIFKFIIKLLGVCLASYALYTLLFWFLWEWEKGPDAYDDSYDRAFLRQIKAIKDKERDPEIIVFGSSCVAFAIDTQTLSEKTGMNAQILGVEASIGDDFLAGRLKKYAKKGDVLVYILGKASDRAADFITVSVAYEADKELLKEYWNEEKSGLKFYRRKLIWRKLYSMSVAGLVENVRSHLSNREQIYTISSFDEKGNMIAERTGNLMGDELNPDDTIVFEDLDADKLEGFNNFYAWCKENDIELYIAYQPYMEGSYTTTEEGLKEFDEKVDKLMDAPVLLSQKDYILPYGYFYNHPYHLNTEGAVVYSEILGEALKGYIKER